MSRGHAPDPVETLVLDLLEWIGASARPYAEVMDAWRTSCPHLPVWEEATGRGFIERRRDEGRGERVAVTAAGREHLARHRPTENAPLGLTCGTVRLATSDPRWPVIFLLETDRLRAAVGRAGLAPLAFEHVGSTSVPGLPAKPILDVMAGHPPGADARPYMNLIVALGYVSRGPQGAPDREMLVLGPETARTHHLNLVEAGGTFWREHLAFRDRLRSDPDLAARYAALKRGLALEHPGDRAAYTDGKAAFVAEVLAAAEVNQGG